MLPRILLVLIAAALVFRSMVDLHSLAEFTSGFSIRNGRYRISMTDLELHCQGALKLIKEITVPLNLL